MNKQGQTISFEMLMWIPRLIYLIIVIIATMGLIFAFIVTNVNVGDVESHILMQRLQFSPEGIVKYDPVTQRVYPGVVDDGKITPNNLKSALDGGEKELAARFVLIDLPETELEPVYLHKETYEDWQPIAIVVGQNDKISGTGRKFPYAEVRYVYSDSPSKLETVVILPNE